METWELEDRFNDAFLKMYRLLLLSFIMKTCVVSSKYPDSKISDHGHKAEFWSLKVGMWRQMCWYRDVHHWNICVAGHFKDMTASQGQGSPNITLSLFQGYQTLSKRYLTNQSFSGLLYNVREIIFSLYWISSPSNSLVPLIRRSSVFTLY